MQKTNGVATWGGIMGAVGGAIALSPGGVLIAYAQYVKAGPPQWYMATILPTLIFGVIVGGVGKALTGWAAQGQESPPNPPPPTP